MFSRWKSPFKSRRESVRNVRMRSSIQEKRVDRATMEMEPDYPVQHFDDLAADLCSSKNIKAKD